MTYGAPIEWDELREKLKEILNWTAFRAKETPVSIDKAINRIDDLLDSYVAQEVKKARIDELDRFETKATSYGWGQTLAIDMSYVTNRLADLGAAPLKDKEEIL